MSDVALDCHCLSSDQAAISFLMYWYFDLQPYFVILLVQMVCFDCLLSVSFLKFLMLSSEQTLQAQESVLRLHLFLSGMMMHCLVLFAIFWSAKQLSYHQSYLLKFLYAFQILWLGICLLHLAMHTSLVSILGERTAQRTVFAQNFALKLAFWLLQDFQDLCSRQVGLQL